MNHGSGPGQQLHSQSSPGDLAVAERQKNEYFCQNSKLITHVTKDRLYESRVRDHDVHFFFN